MYSIGQLSKIFQLSRGTLLYYDSIGILKPSARTNVNYRHYSEADAEKLKEICRYRETGMPLEDIKQILSPINRQTDSLLKKQLDEINREIKKLNIQRQIIVCMLTKRTITQNDLMLKKEILVKVLENSGLGNEGLNKLHAEYEKISPEEHHAFLEFIGISPEEIVRIREYSKKMIG